jgi:hypothetical protein
MTLCTRSSDALQPATERKLAPPPFQALCALLGRMLALSPQTYAEVQDQNEYAAEARARLGDAMGALAGGGAGAWAAAWQQADKAVGAEDLGMWRPPFSSWLAVF